MSILDSAIETRDYDLYLNTYGLEGERDFELYINKGRLRCSKAISKKPPRSVKNFRKCGILYG